MGYFQFFRQTSIDFIGKKAVYYGFSLFMLAATVGGLVWRGGPVLGIDFTGGTLFQVEFDSLPPIEDIRTQLNEAGLSSYTLQTQPADHNIIIRIKQGDRSKEDIAAFILGVLLKAYPGNVFETPDRIEFVGPVIGKKLVKDALMAVLGSLGIIIVYVGFRFKSWVWGLAGVVALAHDVFITIGFLTLLNTEITLVVVAALLTLAGYSINDTIVIFDRVRENMWSARKETLSEIINRSANETLNRTVNTSLTTFFSCMCLMIFGGEVIHDFAVCLTFGIVIGTYSTIGVATSMVHQLETHQRKRG